jgi:hypothetical protein
MLDQATLRSGLERLRARLEEDITERAEEETSIAADLRQRYEAARAAKRTGLSFELWRAGEVTQAAVAWLLACVFVRFLEDNHLIEQPWISGPANRLGEAKEQNLRAYRAGQWQTDRDYLLLCFEEIRKLPGVSALFDKEHNPLFRLTTTGHGARAIIDFFQKADDQGNLVHDFTGTIDNTRFLGDLYQNISESARKRYALVQTPDFVVDFILDRTMEPALQEFGLEGFRIIDPACGSGHFLIAAFERLFHKWRRRLPSIDPIDCASHALASVYGIDLNPFAVAIARFRLLVIALSACGINRLAEAPDFKTNLAAGDSLLHGTRPGTSGDVQQHAFDTSSEFFYETEDKVKLREFLRYGTYHAVVGNPPYITAKDPVLREIYRQRFKSCSGTYQLGVPFTERFFDLLIRGFQSGYAGIITSKSFMNRSFGRKLIEEFIPKWDITHVIDVCGVELEGHDTPTTIMFGRNQLPLSTLVRIVRSVRRDPSNISEEGSPSWNAIVSQIDINGSNSDYISVSDTDRSVLCRHPWSMGGGGAAELKAKLDSLFAKLSTSQNARIGGAARIAHEEVFIFSKSRAHQSKIPEDNFRGYLIGEAVRDWLQSADDLVLFPYGPQGPSAQALKILWPWRRLLESRATFQGVMADAGLNWFDYMQYTPFPYETPISIAFAFVTTNNQFVLDRGGNVFNRSAPALKLPADRSERDAVSLLGLLNSSTVGFWMRQICYSKDGGAEWQDRFEYDGGKLSELPTPTILPSNTSMLLQQLVDRLGKLIPCQNCGNEPITRLSLNKARDEAASILSEMMALQEELDWEVYHLYKLTEESITLPTTQIPNIRLGERAFEIVMARQMADGELETDWFNRHGSTAITQIPTHWPEPYRQLLQERIDVISANPDIALIERPEYKRRWHLPKWEDLEAEALRNWLLDRLEGSRYWPTDPPTLRTVSSLASAAAEDRSFIQIAELWTGRSDFKLDTLVAELVEKHSTPFLPVLRYRGLGLTKRKQWEETWSLQRRADGGETLSIDVPPKYEKTDYLTDTGWRLRGKLDVPKERWVSYPQLTRISDSSLLTGWAGYDHAQQAFALAAFYQSAKEDGSAPSRLVPILAGILDLLPWVKQWHNDPDPATGTKAGDFLEEFLRNEVSTLNLTQDDLRNWIPSEAPKRPRAPRRAGKEKQP